MGSFADHCLCFDVETKFRQYKNYLLLVAFGNLYAIKIVRCDC